MYNGWINPILDYSGRIVGSADKPEDAAVGQALPLACRLDPTQMAARGDLLRALAADHLLSATRTSSGVQLRFSADGSARTRIDELVELERACCPFFRMSISTAGDIVLTIEADGESAAYLDGLCGMAQEALASRSGS